MITATLRDGLLVFETKPGLFSKNEIDAGSKILIDNMEISSEDTVLDLGCGYGAIGLTAAILAHRGKVWMVDTDIRAVKYAKINAGLNKIDNVEVLASDGFEEIHSDIRFDVILSNPPTHAPKETLLEFIEEAHKRLNHGGKLCFVTEKRIRPMIKREFERVFGNYDMPVDNKDYALSLAVKD